MKNLSTVILGLLILVVFVFYMITFQVDYNEVVVVDTFGDAGPESVYVGRPDAGGAGGPFGNLYLKWPVPIQNVHRYDARLRTLETRLEQIQTDDNQSIIPMLFVTWQIDDPLALYGAVRDQVGKVERALESRLRDALEILAQRTFEELTAGGTAEGEAHPLARAEADIRAELQAAMDAPVDFGVTVRSVGIKRNVLPEAVTEKVFQQMRATRERLAQQAQSEGIAEASRIRNQARSQRETIMSFAREQASTIRAEGVAAAAEVYKQFQADESFAKFLREMRSLESMLKQKTTFLIDTATEPFSRLRDPGAGIDPPKRPGAGERQANE